MSNHKAILQRAQLAQQTLPMCLRTDLQVQFEAATQRLDQALKANEEADSLGGGPADTEDIAREIQDLQDRMAGETLRLTFQALPQFIPPGEKTKRHTWETLVAQHPPREEDAEDAKWGFNRDTFWPALAVASLIAPADFDADDWRAFRTAITHGQWELVTDVLWSLNQLKVMPIPFSPAASRILASSAAASKPQPDSDSL